MAKSQAKTGTALSHLVRRERGEALPILTHRVSLGDGSSAEVSSVSMSDAEVPDRSYYGDACAVGYTSETLRIVFAQPKLGKGTGFRTLVIISMAPGSADQFVRSIEDMANPSMDEIARLAGVNEEALLDFPSEEPEQTAALVANFVALAVSGRETTLDFYHANAFSHLNARLTKTMYLEPIVRVNTRTALVLSLIRRLKDVRGQFPVAERLGEEAKQ